MTIYHIPEVLKAIIFDIDSTLYTNEDFAIAQNEIQIKRFAEIKNLDYNDAKEMVYSYQKEWAKINNGKKLSLGNTFVDLGISIEESIKMRKELVNPEKYLFEDEKLVKALRELSKDYSLACVTNNPVSVARKTLACLGADAVLSEIIGLDTCNSSKPDTKMYELAAKRLGVPVENCISIGDRYDIDIATPLEMGMGGILVETVEDVYNLKKMLNFSKNNTEK